MGFFIYFNLNWVVVGVLVYGVICLIEVYGFWYNLLWMEWFVLFSGVIYLLFEVYELFIYFGVFSMVVLLINLVIVFYMYWIICSKVL